MTKEYTFETAFGELKKTLERLENDDLDLETSITLFKEGMEFARLCEQKLKTAEEQIDEVLQQHAELIHPSTTEVK